MDKLQRKFIIDCLDVEEDLTEWESEFINSLAEKDDDFELSEKQNEILNRIQHKTL